MCFQNMFDLLGSTYVLRLSTITQDLLRSLHRIFHFVFNTLGDTNCFGPKNNNYFLLVLPGLSIFQTLTVRTFSIDPQIITDPKLPKTHFMFCSRYWYHINKVPCFLIDIDLISYPRFSRLS